MQNEYEVIKIEIAKLELKPDDVVIIKALGYTSDIEIQNINKVFEKLMPGVKAIIYNENDIELSIMHAQQSMHLTGGISPVRRYFTSLRNIISRLLALTTRK